jgi:hypothetical protein
LIEQAKYEAMWEKPEYRVFAPGEHVVSQFLEVANPPSGASVRDLGCGTGRAGVILAGLGFEVTQYDFAANCRDEGIELPFVQHDLMKPIAGPPADYGYCTDMLEHIPHRLRRRAGPLRPSTRARWRGPSCRCWRTTRSSWRS